MTITVLSLFNGFGGGRLALNDLGITPTAFYASEVDTYANQVASILYPDTVMLGSVTEVDASTLPPIDFLMGGSPCQDFSMAGKMRGMTTVCKQEVTSLDIYLRLKAENFEFTGQSYLFWEYVRLLRATKPRYFMLENVQRMARKWSDLITETLGVTPVDINSALVSAQNRRRLYWCGVRQPDGTYRTASVPQPQDLGILLRDILEDSVGENHYSKYNPTYKSQGNTVHPRDGKSGTLCAGTHGYANGHVVITPVVDRDKARCLTATYAKGDSPDRYFEKNQRQLVFGSRGESDLPRVLREQRTPEAKAERARLKRETGVDFSPRRAKELAPRPDFNANCITASNGDKENILMVPHTYKACTPLEAPLPQGSLCKQVATADGVNFEQNRRVYSADGKSPSLVAGGSSRDNPKVAVHSYNRNGGVGRGLEKAYPTGGSIQPQPRNYKELGLSREVGLEARDDGKANALRAESRNSLVITGAAQRGRYNEDGTTSQRMEVNGIDKANSLTTVGKDSMVAIQQTPRGFNDGKGGFSGLYDIRDYAPSSQRNIRKNSRPDTGKSVAVCTNQTVSASGVTSVDMLDGYTYRKLTVTECARLQTVSELDIQLMLMSGVSNSQLHKMLGNGWTIKVISHIVRHMLGEA